MNLKEVMIDSVKYPFLSVKNVLILSFIVLIGLFVGLTSFFVNGYGYRIIKSSIVGESEPPAFNHWFSMFTDGVKVFMVGFGYALPVFLLIVIYLAAFVSSVMSFPNNASIFVKFGWVGIAVAVVSIAYTIIITPIFAMALVYMADNNDHFSAAFRFREILDKIATWGWKKFIIWYLTLLLAIIIAIEAIVVSTIISNMFNLPFQLLSAFILAILFMYICRSVALFYNSESLGFLVCEQCGGYYELKPGESPEDFDSCECGGKLKYTKLNPNTEESDDLITDDTANKVGNRRSFGSRFFKKNKDSMLLIGVVALSIIAIPVLIHSTQNQTPTNYTLLGTYNASNLSAVGTLVYIPQGTKNIKIDYNLSANTTSPVHDIIVDAYNTNITTGGLPSNSNEIDGKSVGLENGQNKTGTIIFSNSRIKSIVIEGADIQGTINVYTSQ